MRFENQTAVVAACGSDAGAACALNYLQQGAKVALYYDEEARLWPFDQISEVEIQTAHHPDQRLPGP